MNCPIHHYSVPQPAPCGAASFPAFQGAVLAAGHFQVLDGAMVVQWVIDISGEGHGAWCLQP